MMSRPATFPPYGSYGSLQVISCYAIYVLRAFYALSLVIRECLPEILTTGISFSDISFSFLDGGKCRKVLERISMGSMSVLAQDLYFVRGLFVPLRAGLTPTVFCSVYLSIGSASTRQFSDMNTSESSASVVFQGSTARVNLV